MGYEVKHYVEENIWSSQKVICHVIMFQCSKIYHLWWRGQGEEILFVNLSLKELGSPKPPTKNPYSHLIIQIGMKEFGTYRMRKQLHHEDIMVPQSREDSGILYWKNNKGFLMQWMNQDPEGWENESIILWLAACRELKAIGVPACLLSQPGIN